MSSPPLSPPALKRDKSSGKQELVTSVQHTTHVTFDSATGKFVGLPKEWEKAVTSSFGLPPALYISEVVPGYVSKIPQVLVMMRQYLHDKNGFMQHGIFRVAPDQQERDMVLQQLASGTFRDCRDVHCISTAIKVWFRELPTPLFKSMDIEALKNCNSDEEATRLLETQTEPAKSLALWLMDVCCDVIEFSKVNAMSAKNMSIVVSPNLIRLEGQGDNPLEVFKISKRFTDFFERCLNVRMKHRASNFVPSRKISIRPVAHVAGTPPVSSSSLTTKEEEVPPAPESSEDELPPEHPPPEPASDEEEPPSLPPPAQTGFVLPLVNPGEMLSFQLAEYFPTWRALLEPHVPKGTCVECEKVGTIFCQSCYSLLCATHDEALHSFRSRAGHVRCTASEAVGAPSMCEPHAQPLKLFCLTCGRPVCRDCREYGPHEGHMVVLIIFALPRKPTIEQKMEQKMEQKNVSSASSTTSTTTATTATNTHETDMKDRDVSQRGKDSDQDSSTRRSEMAQREDGSVSKVGDAPKRPAPTKQAPRLPNASPLPRSSATVSTVFPSVPVAISPPPSPSTTIHTDSTIPQATVDSEVPPPPPPPEFESSAPVLPVTPRSDDSKSSLTSQTTTTTTQSATTPIKTTTPTATTTLTVAKTILTPAESTTLASATSTAGSDSDTKTVSDSKPTPSTSSVATLAAIPQTEGAFTPGQQVRALFDFSRSQKGYVTMTAREILTVIKSSPQLSATGWVLVKSGAGISGYVPFNYVRGL